MKINKKFIMITGYVITGLFPFACFAVLEYIHFADKERFFSFLTTQVSIVFFDLAIMYLVYAVLLLLVKRAWIASLMYGTFLSAVALTNFYKFGITGDYFYPWDFVQQASNVHILVTYLTPPPLLYVCLILVIAALIVATAFTHVKIPLKYYYRIPAAILIVAITFFAVATPHRVEKILNNSGLFLEDMALQQSNYAQNGFIGATVINILSGNINKPDNYSKAGIDALLGKYQPKPASENFAYPDIIIVLAESYWDVRNLPGTTFSIDPLANYDEIIKRNNCYSGRFFTTAFGGGTVRPEFELLTGLTTDMLPGGTVPYQYIHSDFESYITPYKNLGYSTYMLHPYISSFYMRSQKFGYLGFDKLYFYDELEAIESIEPELKGGSISDESFVDYIQYLLDINNHPKVLFGITMENHQPFHNKFDDSEIEVSVGNPNLDADTFNLLTRYTQGVIDTDRALKKLADYIDSRERPTVLVFFGDHAPSLGANYAAYVQSGLVESTANLTTDERIVTQSTPYLIYSNFALQPNGMNGDIASYNLLNLLATLIGAPQTPLMQYLQNYYKVSPHYNVRLEMDITDEIENFIDGHAMITYDRIAGRGYSVP
ncbi:MAG: LTA synthase family protein [Oscillospiraceae bacterium]|nr:LTA synthase family protein [Oscillospiraceae bacterium]